MRRWRERYEEFGYDGLFDQGKPSPKLRNPSCHFLFVEVANFCKIAMNAVVAQERVRSRR
jgi:hypothetical protein